MPGFDSLAAAKPMRSSTQRINANLYEPFYFHACYFLRTLLCRFNISFLRSIDFLSHLSLIAPASVEVQASHRQRLGVVRKAQADVLVAEAADAAQRKKDAAAAAALAKETAANNASATATAASSSSSSAAAKAKSQAPIRFTAPATHLLLDPRLKPSRPSRKRKLDEGRGQIHKACRGGASERAVFQIVVVAHSLLLIDYILSVILYCPPVCASQVTTLLAQVRAGTLSAAARGAGFGSASSSSSAASASSSSAAAPASAADDSAASAASAELDGGEEDEDEDEGSDEEGGAFGYDDEEDGDGQSAPSIFDML